MAFAITSVVRVYHAYKDIWDAEIDSELPCSPEPDNREDRYAVAVMNGTNVVGHVPRRISYICNLFIRHSGSIICRVTGPRQYSREQGGLEVPCEFRLYSKDQKRVKKSRELLKKASYATKDIKTDFQEEVSSSATSNPVKVKVEEDSNNDKPVAVLPQSKPVIHEVDDTTQGNVIPKKSEGASYSRQWLRIGGIKLTPNDKDAIMNGQRLNDLVINFAQKVLKMQFPGIKGFQSTLLQEKRGKGTFYVDKVQIIHSHGNHWIVAATIETTSHDVKVYDSVYDVVDGHTALLISNIFGTLAKPKSVVIPKQLGEHECGLYAIANAAALCFGKDPATLHFNQSLMRIHLVQCLEQKRIANFPLI